MSRKLGGDSLGVGEGERNDRMGDTNWRTLLNGALLAFVAEEDLDFLLVSVGELGEGFWHSGLLWEGVHVGDWEEFRFVDWWLWIEWWFGSRDGKLKFRFRTPHWCGVGRGAWFQLFVDEDSIKEHHSFSCTSSYSLLYYGPAHTINGTRWGPPMKPLCSNSVRKLQPLFPPSSTRFGFAPLIEITWIDYVYDVRHHGRPLSRVTTKTHIPRNPLPLIWETFWKIKWSGDNVHQSLVKGFHEKVFACQNTSEPEYLDDFISM